MKRILKKYSNLLNPSKDDSSEEEHDLKIKNENAKSKK